MKQMDERILFTIDWTMNFGALRDLITKAFGLTIYDGEDLDGFNIVCRLDQFARFLIMRNAMGLPNNFKSLNAKIICDPSLPIRRIFDVSNNNKVGTR